MRIYAVSCSDEGDGSATMWFGKKRDAMAQWREWKASEDYAMLDEYVIDGPMNADKVARIASGSGFAKTVTTIKEHRRRK